MKIPVDINRKRRDWSCKRCDESYGYIGINELCEACMIKTHNEYREGYLSNFIFIIRRCPKIFDKKTLEEHKLYGWQAMAAKWTVTILFPIIALVMPIVNIFDTRKQIRNVFPRLWK